MWKAVFISLSYLWAAAEVVNNDILVLALKYTKCFWFILGPLDDVSKTIQSIMFVAYPFEKVFFSVYMWFRVLDANFKIANLAGFYILFLGGLQPSKGHYAETHTKMVDNSKHIITNNTLQLQILIKCHLLVLF